MDDAARRGWPSELRAIYALAVVADIAILWYRNASNLKPGLLVFHLAESAIKLGIMLLVLRGRRWAAGVQILLSLLALLSSLALLGQPNARAARDPLVWVSLGAQLLAGLICAWAVGRRRASAAVGRSGVP